MTQSTTERLPEELDELGPVDWIVVEFPGSRFKGEIVPTAAVVAHGVSRRTDRRDDRRDDRGDRRD